MNFTVVLVFGRLRLGDGDAHSGLGHEGTGLELGRHFHELLLVQDGRQAELLRAQDGRSVDEVEVVCVVGVKVERVRAALRARPELDARLVHLVRREVVQQLGDLVVVEGLEGLQGPEDAVLGVLGLLVDQHLLQQAEVRHLLAGVHRLQALQEAAGVSQVLVDLLGRVREQVLKLAARPLDRVQDLVGEVLERARGRLLLGRVVGGAVRLGDVRVDHLSVALGAHRARLQQRLFVEHAPSVHVSS